jgi:tetratricopeptide (TPR) repeat protein
VVAFIPAVTGGWIYDDHPLIQNNVYVHSFSEWPRWFLTDFWNVSAEITHFASRILYWRPAVSASYAVDWKLGGGSPLMFHITNTVLQAVTSGLVFVTLRRWVGSPLPALAAALLFVVHPTKVESVAWISGRTDIMCLLAVLVASAGVARRREGRHGGIAMEVAGTLVAYLAKEQAIVLPCFVAVEVWVAAGRPAIDRATIVRLVRGAAPQLAIAIVYLAVRALVLPIRAAVHMSVGDHGRAVLETFGRFFTLTVAPHDLSIQQGLVHTIHHETVYSGGYVAIGAVSIVALIVMAWVLRRRAPIVTLGIALYFATVAPTSNLAVTGLVTLISERFLYLPLIGLALAFAGGIELAERRFGRRIYAVPVVFAIALTAISMGRSHDYTDEHAFWAREMALHPDSPEARKQALAFYSRNHRYYDALAIWQRPQPYDIPIRDRMQLASNVVSMMSRLVPDKDTAHLEAIDRFCERLLAKQPAALDFMGVQLTFDTPLLAETKAFENARSTLLDLRADLQSRLGHDAEAVALSGEPLALCPSCSTLMASYALALARAARYDEAFAALDAATQMPADERAEEQALLTAAHDLHVESESLQGAAALQARASELAKLELWGRAFDVLAPYEAEIARAPKFVVGFAELAFRAGETATARRVLSASKSSAEIDALIAEWAAKMGWTS